MFARRIALFAVICAGGFAVMGLTGSVLAASFSATVENVSKEVPQISNRTYRSGDKLRQDQMLNNRPLLTAIYRLDKGVIWLIMVGDGYYTETPTTKDKQVDDLVGIMAQKGKKIGVDKFAGYQCDKYRITSPYTAHRLDKHKYVPYKVNLTRTLWYSPELKAVIKTESKPTTPGFYDTILTNIKQGPQPAALFELPKGLKKRTPPTLPTGKQAGGRMNK